MPAKPSQRAEINNFIQGLITEASPLNFPPNASADEENFDLRRDGSRERRLGMDFEAGASFYNTGITPDTLEAAGINSYKWIEVAGKPEIEFLVIQFNQKIYFFDLSSPNLSSTGYRGTVTLSSFPTNTRFSFTGIEGFLIVASGVDVIAKIEYISNSFFVSYDRLKVRDVWGLEETNPLYENDISYRGPTADPAHYYNLQNQSWGVSRLAFEYPDYQDPVVVYMATTGVAPSNSEQVWAGMQYQAAPDPSSEPTEKMYPSMYSMVIGSSPSSARGYFIIDALRRGQSRVDAVYANNSKYPPLNGAYSVTFPSDFTPGGASIVAEFSGRVFYSGFRGEVLSGDKRSPNFVNYVFFSQLVKNGSDIVKCYQEGDPTSRESSDIVDTDGGFLRISEAKNIISLINLGANLVAIASNGVWLISGGSDYGFSATNYKVSKLSNFGCVSNSSVVVEGERAYFWSEDGIYIISRNQFGDYEVTNITEKTIQRLYEGIPNVVKAKAYGIYDNSDKKIRWIYNVGGAISREGVTRELVLDVSLSSFSQYRINRIYESGCAALTLFQSNPYQADIVDNIVEVGDDEVFAGSDVVVLRERVRTSGALSTRYLSVKVIDNRINFSFSLYRDSDFIDWQSVDGVGLDAKAYCLTGNQTTGDTGTDKQIPYLIMHFRRTETSLDSNFELQRKSGCLIRGQWNFANSIASNKWTPLMQAYRYRTAQLMTSSGGAFDNGFEIISSKTKLRGIGKAFALYFETEPKKDCKIVGWNITLNGNSVT